MKVEKSCGCIVYIGEGETRRYLILQHKNGGHWAFPKGHVEEGETEEQTALREVKEETGLSVNIQSGFRETTRYSPKPGVTKQVVYFLAGAESDKAHAQQEEVSAIRFLPAQEALSLITHNSDRRLLQKALVHMRALEK